MSESYVECLVKKETSPLIGFLKILLIMIAAAFLILTLAGFVAALIIAIPAGIGAYFAWLNANVEYEYLYLDKEISVDRIQAQTRRKRIAAFDLERMEIFAPIKSYHLDNYRNRTAKVLDYSVGKEEQPDKRYVMFYDGKQKVILNPSEEFIKVVRNAAPRKVFTD